MQCHYKRSKLEKKCTLKASEIELLSSNSLICRHKYLITQVHPIARCSITLNGILLLMKNSSFFSSSLKSLKRSLTGAPTFLSNLSSSGYSVLLKSEAPNFASLKSSPTQILGSFELFKKLLMFLSSIAFFHQEEK